MIVVLFATACGSGTTENPSPNTTGAEPTAAPTPGGKEDVFFPEVRQEGGLDAVSTAMGGGELALGDEGCLRMLYGEDPKDGWVPVWPPYLEPEAGGGAERNGRTVGRVGEGISMSGGDIPKEALREDGILDGETRRELFKRCPPGYSYWIVGGGVRISRRHQPFEDRVKIRGCAAQIGRLLASWDALINTNQAAVVGCVAPSA